MSDDETTPAKKAKITEKTQTSPPSSITAPSSNVPKPSQKPFIKRQFSSNIKYIDPSLTKDKQQNFDPIVIRWIKEATELHSFSREHLSHELKRRGCKSGGTQQQLAERLFAIKGLDFKDIPSKYKFKEPKKKVLPKLLPETRQSNKGKRHSAGCAGFS